MVRQLVLGLDTPSPSGSGYSTTGGSDVVCRGILIGTCYLHTVIIDHSRVAYVEVRDDETTGTATEILWS